MPKGCRGDRKQLPNYHLMMSRKTKHTNRRQTVAERERLDMDFWNVLEEIFWNIFYALIHYRFAISPHAKDFKYPWRLAISRRRRYVKFDKSAAPTPSSSKTFNISSLQMFDCLANGLQLAVFALVICVCLFFFCGAQNETEIKNWNSIKFQPANPDRKVTPEHWLLRGNNLYHTQLNPKQLNCQLRCHPNPLFIHIHLFFDFGSSLRLPEDREDVVICWLSPGDGK